MSDRYAYTVYCDDIRHELGNKESLMGIYAGYLFVNEFPIVLPKLCIQAFFNTPTSDFVKSLTVIVEQDGEIIRSSEFPSEYLEQTLEQMLSTGTPEDPVDKVFVGGSIILSPLYLDKPCTLFTKFIVDGEEYYAGKLRVKLGNDASMISATN